MVTGFMTVHFIPGETAPHYTMIKMVVVTTH
jgi:hypothetical protein